MLIHHSQLLLEQLSVLEEKIQQIEKVIENLKVDCDSEALLKSILARKYHLLLASERKN